MICQYTIFSYVILLKYEQKVDRYFSRYRKQIFKSILNLLTDGRHGIAPAEKWNKITQNKYIFLQPVTYVTYDIDNMLIAPASDLYMYHTHGLIFALMIFFIKNV